MVPADLRSTQVTRFEYANPNGVAKTVVNAEDLKDYSLEVLNSRVGRKDAKTHEMEVSSILLTSETGINGHTYQSDW